MYGAPLYYRIHACALNFAAWFSLRADGLPGFSLLRPEPLACAAHITNGAAGTPDDRFAWRRLLKKAWLPLAWGHIKIYV
jgi:hypothetical protein